MDCRQLPAVPFKNIYAVDFEYRADPGERPWPLCMVVKDLLTDAEHRYWRDALLNMRAAPFDVSHDSLVVAYSASAEIGCFLELDWPLPMNVLDLYAEHRVETNGRELLCGNGLLGALACRGLAHIDAGEKETMRRLVIERFEWLESEKQAILDYCASDVAGLAALFPAMAPMIDWPRALLRGRFAAALAHMERAGVPIDLPLHQRLVANWEPLKLALITDVDAEFGIYDGASFKTERFARWLIERDMPWPRLPSGRLMLDDETFKQQTMRWPELKRLRELRASLGRMRLTGLAVGADARNRCSLRAFMAATGRNQPSNTEFIFGPAKWMRGLIRPPEGWGIAYIDFAAQEIAIAAALSADQRMAEAYASSDPYLAFAREARLVPADATIETHGAVRDRCKAVMLGVNYGMASNAMAFRLGVTPIEARVLLQLHRRAYPQFWRWMDQSVSRAMATNEMMSVFGWRRHVGRTPKIPSLMNFPMQANGAEMMRIAAIAATEAGIEVVAQVHDAFMIVAPLHRLDEDVARMRAMMTAAGRAVTAGLDIRTEAKMVRWPDRFMSEGAEAMWLRVMALLDYVEVAQ